MTERERALLAHCENLKALLSDLEITLGQEARERKHERAELEILREENHALRSSKVPRRVQQRLDLADRIISAVWGSRSVSAFNREVQADVAEYRRIKE